MQKSDVVAVLRYLGDIRYQLRALAAEADQIEAGYDPLRSVNIDGMPHGAAPGDVTAATAEKMIANGAAERLQELHARAEVLRSDAALIRGQIDRLRDVYKTVLLMRYVHGNNWHDVAAKIKYSEAQAKRLRLRGIVRLGELLEDVPMAAELVARARDARD